MFVAFDEVMVFVFKMTTNYFISTHHMTRRLKLLHGNNVGRLNVVLELGDLLLEIIKRDLLVLDDKVDLELLDTEADGDELGSTPDEAVLLDGTDTLLEGNHVGLIICGEAVLAGMPEKVNH